MKQRKFGWRYDTLIRHRSYHKCPRVREVQTHLQDIQSGNPSDLPDRQLFYQTKRYLIQSIDCFVSAV